MSEDATSPVRKYVDGLVAPSFRIDVQELADSLGIEFVNDKFDVEGLLDAPKVVLQRVMLATTSWGEYIATRKIAALANLSKHEITLSQDMAAKRAEYIATLGGTKFTKADVEAHMDAQPDFVDVKTKLSNYKHYVQYLDSLTRQLDMLHYAAKEILRDTEKREATGRY